MYVIKILHRVLLCAVDKRSDCGAGAYLIEERHDLYLLDLKVWTQTCLITINFLIKQLISITLWHSLESPNCYSTNYMGVFFDLYLVSLIAVAPQKVQWDWECQCLIGLVPIWNSPSAKYKKLLLAKLTVIPTHFFFQMMSARWGKIPFSIKNIFLEKICPEFKNLNKFLQEMVERLENYFCSIWLLKKLEDNKRKQKKRKFFRF